jgi:hypothetical protein
MSTLPMFQYKEPLFCDANETQAVGHFAIGSVTIYNHALVMYARSVCPIGLLAEARCV